MYGLSWPGSRSNHSCACSCEHARGERPEALAELDLQVHRRLHRRRARVAEDAAGAERARAELHPALEPADDLAVGQQLGDVRRAARPRRRTRWYVRADAVEERGDLVRREARAEEAALLASRGRRRVRGLSSSWCQTNSAAPSAPPASPAAGWIQMSSNGPSRSSRPLATQFSATPPARTRLLHAGLRVDVPADAQHRPLR